MSIRQALHELVDGLPEEDLITAFRVLKGLELAPDRLTVLLEHAPLDDESDEDDFDGGLTEALEDSGPSIPHEEVMRRFRD